MARAEVLSLMKELRLIGMPAVYDEVMAQARKRRQSGEAVLETAADRGMVNRDAAFSHHRFEIAVIDRVPTVLR